MGAGDETYQAPSMGSHNQMQPVRTALLQLVVHISPPAYQPAITYDYPAHKFQLAREVPCRKDQVIEPCIPELP